MVIYIGKQTVSYITSMLTLVKVNGVDVTSKLKDYLFDRSFGDATNQIEVNFVKNVTSLVTLDNGQKLEVWRGWNTPTDEKIFDGKIESYLPSGGVLKVIGKDKMSEIRNREVNQIYNSTGLQGGVVSKIARDLVVNGSKGLLYAGPHDNTPDTLLLYSFQDATNIYDHSGNSTIAGTSSNITQIDGNFGNAISLNGTTSYIRTPVGSSLDLPYEFTVDFWMKKNGGSTTGVLVGRRWGSGDSNFQIEILAVGGRLRVNLADTTGTVGVFNDDNLVNLVNNNWHRITVSYDGLNLSMWIDGALQSSTGNFPGQLQSNTNTYTTIGYSGYASHESANGWDGSIDDLKISASATPRTSTISSLTDSVVDSGTLITLGKFICRRTNLFERVKTLCDAVDYQVFYLASTNKVYFQPKGYTLNQNTITIGGSSGNVIETPSWNFDNTELANSITVIGASIFEPQTTEYFNGNGSTKVFSLSQKPISVRVLVGGVLKTGGGIDVGGNPLNDYSVDKEVKTLTFKTAPASGTNNIQVDYGYNIPTPVTEPNQSSIDKYGLWQKTFTYNDISSAVDAQARVYNLLSRYSTPFTYVTLKVKGGSIVSLNVGQKVTVVDNVNNFNKQVVVNRHIVRFPSVYDEIYVGDKEWKMAEWGTQVEEKIKRLQEEAMINQATTLNVQNVGANIPLQTTFNIYKRVTTGEFWLDAARKVDSANKVDRDSSVQQQLVYSITY